MASIVAYGLPYVPAISECGFRDLPQSSENRHSLVIHQSSCREISIFIAMYGLIVMRYAGQAVLWAAWNGMQRSATSRFGCPDTLYLPTTRSHGNMCLNLLVLEQSIIAANWFNPAIAVICRRLRPASRDLQNGGFIIAFSPSWSYRKRTSGAGSVSRRKNTRSLIINMVTVFRSVL